MAARLLAMGRRFPVSKSLIVDNPVPLADASSGWDQFNRARAARDWAGVSIIAHI